MANWVGTQGQVNLAKKRKYTPSCDVIPRNAQILNEKSFLNLQFKTCWIHWGFEQLSSSIAWRVIELQTFQKLQKKWLTRDLKGSNTFGRIVECFVWISSSGLGNFSNARKQMIFALDCCSWYPHSKILTHEKRKLCKIVNVSCRQKSFDKHGKPR